MTGQDPSRIGRRAAGAAVLVWIAVASSPTFAVDVPGAEARGDLAFARRAVGADGLGRLSPEGEAAAREAVAAYEEALRQEPDDIDLRFKTIEALYFLGSFARVDRTRRVELIDRQLELTEQTLSHPTAIASPALQAEGHFWAAISWGMWAMNHSAIAAIRRRVPAKIRDHAQWLIDHDVTYGDAGGLRLLGRLHTMAPRVPLVSGWIDRSHGLELLEQAHRLSDHDPRNALFFAEALLELRPSRRDEALGLLRALVARSPEPSYRVEQSETLRDAQRILEEEQEEEGG